MIIEFAGPSCSGKSTLMRRLKQALDDQLVPARSFTAWSTTRSEKLSALKLPRIAAWSLLNPGLLRGESARQLLGAIGRVHRLKRSKELVLIDEGPVKLHKRRPLRRSRGERILLAGIPAPDVLVIVECDPHLRLARIREQGRIHAKGRSDEEILADQTGLYFARRFAAVRKVPVVEIDTSGEVDPLPRLFEQLRPFIAGSRQARPMPVPVYARNSAAAILLMTSDVQALWEPDLQLFAALASSFGI